MNRPRSSGRRASLASSVRSAGGEVMALSRLVLAAKTAVAAAVAWYLAPLVPFADADYSYYAPMGVLVSMYPTVADSARAGLQAIIGLAIGILLGFGGLAVVGAGAPGVVAIAIVVGVGVALGGIRSLGIGRDWIALAGLIVLVVGGGNPDEFSTSYLVTMAFGVAVGVAANYILMPPLYLREVGAQLVTLRERIAANLEQTADLVAAGEVDPDRLAAGTDELTSLALTVAEGVREAGRSARGNPRGRRRETERATNERAWAALERAALLVREVMEALMRHPEIAGDTPGQERTAFQDALRACATLMATPLADPEREARVEAASAAVARYARNVTVGSAEAAQVSPALAVAGYLSRIVQLCEPAEDRE